MNTATATVSVLDRALRILHLEDNPLDRQLIQEMLESEGFAANLTCVDTRGDFVEALADGAFDIILSDQALPTFDGFAALHFVKENYPDIPFVFVTGSMGEEAAIETIKDGATDYVLKDRLTRLIPAIERAIREADQAQRNRLASQALRESEERFQLIARASNDAIWDWNIQTGACWHSAGFKDFGYSEADIAHRTRLWLDQVPAEHQERIRQGLNQVVRSRETNWFDEYPLRRGDGSISYVFNRGYIVRNTSGEAVRMVGAMMDVTQRKLAEQLIAERSRLTALHGDVNSAIGGDASMDECLQKCAQSIIRHLDVTVARIWTIDETGEHLRLRSSAGLEMQQGIAPIQIPMGQFKAGRIAAERKPFFSNSFQSEIEGSDPEWQALENMSGFAGYPLMVEEKIFGVVTVFSRRPLNEFAVEAVESVAREVALGIERRVAAEKIKEQAALLDKAQDAIFVPSLSNVINYWNKSAERLYGWSANEVQGRDASQLLHKADSPALRDAMKAVQERGEWTGELIQSTRDNREITVKSHWSLVRGNDGQPECVLIVNTDITDQKRLEAQLLRSQRLESIGSLASGIAHDLNNVLAPIMIGVAYLKDSVQEKSSREILAAIESSVTRGAEIVKQVLTFARGVSGEMVSLQPNKLIREIERIARETFPKSIRVQMHCEPDAWNIRGDETQIHQVLLNLFVNARDAMPRGGELTISSRNVFLKEPLSGAGLTGQPGPYVQIEVSDTGSGIALDIQKKIFQPFFTTKDLNKGTGLGLSTTVSILQNHGGLINLASEPGKGTTFAICFPAISTEPQEIIPPAEALDETSGDQHLILLVDDELAIREMCKLILESCDYRVLTAENGAEALALFERHKAEVDVVITDMMMPVMDGPTAVRAMRWSTPDLKVIVTSGMNEKELSLGQGDFKANSFLQKPYTADQLLKKVAEMVRKE